MKNKKIIIVSLVSLGLGYYFGIKKGEKNVRRALRQESLLPQ